MTPKKYLLPLYDPHFVNLFNIRNSLTNKMDTSVLKQVHINNDLKHLAANHYIHTSYKFQAKHVAGHCVGILLVLILYILAHFPLVVKHVLSFDRTKDVLL